MAFRFTNSKGKTYFLHAITRKTKSGKKSQLFYFALTVKDGALDAVPMGYEVTETKSGLPALKKK